MIRRPPRSTLDRSSAASDVYKRQVQLNQRNYYRILQVQPDAPIATITASYQALRKNSSQETALLDEAYRVLSNPDARKQYDAILVGILFLSLIHI